MLKLTRIAAWAAVLGLIVLTVVPPSLRPITGTPHAFEHFASFVLVGALWCLAYVERLVPWLVAAAAFAAGIELIQIFVPGRHARFTDFAVDATGACAGILLAFVAMWAIIACQNARSASLAGEAEGALGNDPAGTS